MPITPPLDRIPALPAKGVSLLMKEVNKQISSLVDEVNKLNTATNKLKEVSTCSDSDTVNAKNQLDRVLKQINEIQKLPPKIEPVVTTLKVASSTAQAIKAAQLLNPVTAPAIIAAELLLVQNMTIANSIQAINQLQQIPIILKDSLSGLSVQLKQSLDTLSNVCNIDQESYKLLPDLIDQPQDLDTEFYNEFNVSDSDLTDRLEKIQELVNTQQNLLSSLQEAPSKVYEGTNQPIGQIGKPGDYFVDTANQYIYGPKILKDQWPEGIKY